jgi:hypothetical protein
MEVGLHANMSDQATNHVATALYAPLKALGARLSGEYGGVMEHLWIDVDLIESHATPDGKSRFPFRFQKRVSGRSHFGLPAAPDKFNVGHYSVRPDFQLITSLPTEQIVPHVLSLIYKSTSVLFENQKRLGGFDATLFRQSFLLACEGIGCELSENAL